MCSVSVHWFHWDVISTSMQKLAVLESMSNYFMSATRMSEELKCHLIYSYKIDQVLCVQVGGKTMMWNWYLHVYHHGAQSTRYCQIWQNKVLDKKWQIWLQLPDLTIHEKPTCFIGLWVGNVYSFRKENTF